MGTKFVFPEATQLICNLVQAQRVVPNVLREHHARALQSYWRTS
jgi:hypothetical protein